jgi:TonB family protein
MHVGTLEETINVTAGQSYRAGRSSVDAVKARAAFQNAMAACAASGSPANGKIRPPRKLRNVAPDYPEGLRAAGIGGTVRLDAVIDGYGLVREVKPAENQPIDPSLIAAAVDAVQQWEFDGTLLNCLPIDVVMKVSVTFNP